MNLAPTWGAWVAAAVVLNSGSGTETHPESLALEDGNSLFLGGFMGQGSGGNRGPVGKQRKAGSKGQVRGKGLQPRPGP
eukprot:2972740-Rhodomonas_salina.1